MLQSHSPPLLQIVVQSTEVNNRSYFLIPNRAVFRVQPVMQLKTGMVPPSLSTVAVVPSDNLRLHMCYACLHDAVWREMAIRRKNIRRTKISPIHHHDRSRTLGPTSVKVNKSHKSRERKLIEEDAEGHQHDESNRNPAANNSSC